MNVKRGLRITTHREIPEIFKQYPVPWVLTFTCRQEGRSNSFGARRSIITNATQAVIYETAVEWSSSACQHLWDLYWHSCPAVAKYDHRYPEYQIPTILREHPLPWSIEMLAHTYPRFVLLDAHTCIITTQDDDHAVLELMCKLGQLSTDVAYRRSQGLPAITVQAARPYVVLAQ